MRRLAGEDLGLASLSLASGCTDALSFMKLGDLFTSAMTGNTALLAVAVGRGEWVSASHSSCALLGFVLGVALAAVFYAKWDVQPDPLRRLRKLLLLELAFLGGCALLWSASPDPLRGGMLYAVIGLSAFSMGIQAVAARSINASGISTVVFTSALVSIVMAKCGALGRPAADSAAAAAAGGHLRTFALYGCGALLAALLVSRFLAVLIWVPVAAVLLALGLSALVARPERSEH